jgi:hypothetical protein
MIRDIKRNSQGIIISTQLDDLGDDYSYIGLERSVRKFNQNTAQTSKSTFNEVYDDRITDIEFEEIKVANSYTFIDKSTGKQINLNETDPAFLISELNPNLTENIPDEVVGGVGSVGGTTTTSAGASVGMLTSAGASVGMLTSAGGGVGTLNGSVNNNSNITNPPSNNTGSFIGGSSGDGSSDTFGGSMIFYPFGVAGQYQSELRTDSTGLQWIWDLGLMRWVRQTT